jgi:hypothetical protein
VPLSIALRAKLHGRANSNFIHVVPNPLLLLSTNALAHFWILIMYVKCIFLGVFSERTKIEVALNSAVPSVKSGLKK